jgi:hypothetical protein
MTLSRWDEAAMGKLTRVLGRETGMDVYTQALHTLGMAQLASADDLHRFAQHVAGLGGFAGAVGGLLSVHSVIHGAKGI